MPRSIEETMAALREAAAQQVKLADGKYTVIQHGDGHFQALRYGEFWGPGEHLNNLEAALAERVFELEAKLAMREG